LLLHAVFVTVYLLTENQRDNQIYFSKEQNEGRREDIYFQALSSSAKLRARARR